MTRLTRDTAKRAVKTRPNGPRPRWGIDGPGCPYCAGRLNSKFKRATLLAKQAAREIDEALRG